MHIGEPPAQHQALLCEPLFLGFLQELEACSLGADP